MLSSKKNVEPLEPIRENWFQNFIARRSFLIHSYESGEIDKKEFLKKNLEELNRSNLKPFIAVDRLEKAIFNYQYYNAMAKHYRMLAKNLPNTKKKNRQYGNFLSLADKYYNLKDQTILHTLELCKPEDVEAYYINCEAKYLDTKLYEIVFLKEKELIYHSMSKWLLEILVEKNIFKGETRCSLIDTYINDTY